MSWAINEYFVDVIYTTTTREHLIIYATIAAEAGEKAYALEVDDVVKTCLRMLMAYVMVSE